MVAVVSQIARLPLLLAYLVAGFAIGPHGFKTILSVHDIETISGIGLSLLLFMVGLEIDLKKMAERGPGYLVHRALAQIGGCLLLGLAGF